MQKNTDHALSWMGLSSIPGVGRVTFRKLASHFGSPEQALSASADAFRNEGLSDEIVHEIASGKWREHAEQELEKAERANIAIITADDPAYPDSLKNTSDHPLYLYVKGSLQKRDSDAVAIVGTRRPTHYGITLVNRMASDLASAENRYRERQGAGASTLRRTRARSSKRGSFIPCQGMWSPGTAGARTPSSSRAQLSLRAPATF